MRTHFPNTTRPKKAAQRLAALFPDMPLAKAQDAVAVACGYRDWHDLDRSHAESPPSPLDDALPTAAFRNRAIELCWKLSAATGVDDGTTQAALPALRLLGNRGFTLADHEAIRTACWRRGALPRRGPKEPGGVFIMQEQGYGPQKAYWIGAGHGGTVEFLTEAGGKGLCAGSEAAEPDGPADDFIPDRFWLPYGWWKDREGNEILFSRDYIPLWLIRSGGGVDRLPPSHPDPDWVERKWFAGEDAPAWRTGEARARALAKLREHGITVLPGLVDALPLLIQGQMGSTKAAARRLTPPCLVVSRPRGPVHRVEAKSAADARLGW